MLTAHMSMIKVRFIHISISSKSAAALSHSEQLQIMTCKSYQGDGASMDEGGLVCGLAGWNERRRRGNVGRSSGSAERHADSIIYVLDQVGGRVED